MQAISLLGNWPSLQNLWHFEIATMRKPKMLNISKTADCRAKRILDHRLWHFEIFLNTGPYAVENFKALFNSPSTFIIAIQTL